jgi:hypothetical protein
MRDFLLSGLKTLSTQRGKLRQSGENHTLKNLIPIVSQLVLSDEGFESNENHVHCGLSSVNILSV